MIKIFAVGDVVGRTGRLAVVTFLDRIREKFKPDIMLLNGENAAGGFGLTEKIYREFTEELGFDAITMGNHWHDKREIYKFKDHADRLVLPGNMGNVDDEGAGLRIIKSHSGHRFAVINLIGKAFMHDNNRNPFDAASRLVGKIPPSVPLRIVDMHAEATSEKQGMGMFLRGKVSLVYGTHSHVPTADERIISPGTGFVTDLGATGAYDSIIGMNAHAALKRMLTGERAKLEPAKGDPWLCACIATVDPESGKCVALERIRWEVNNMDEVQSK